MTTDNSAVRFDDVTNSGFAAPPLLQVPTVVVHCCTSLVSRRSMFKGVCAVAAENGWRAIQCEHPLDGNVEILGVPPSAVIFGPESGTSLPSSLQGVPAVAVFQDLSSLGIPSFEEDSVAVGRMAGEHLASNGLRQFAFFSRHSSRWSDERRAGFELYLSHANLSLEPGGLFDPADSTGTATTRDRILRWLNALPRPCGIFAACDEWARDLAIYCEMLGLRVPEDIAILGANLDPLVTEAAVPQLSSVAIPWEQIGQNAAMAILSQLRRERVAPQPVRTRPLEVVVRRSTDVIAIADEHVAAAVRWIRANARSGISVDDVIRAVPIHRRRLERKFRALLGRSIFEEIRRARVESVKDLLRDRSLTLGDVALKAGFANPTLMGIALRCETGLTPGKYRKCISTDSLIPGLPARFPRAC